jgi:predicted dehydrogenase
VCLASSEAEELEKLAADRGTLLYQSTLERYNPLIKFLAKNIAADAIREIESYRFGQRPRHALDEDAKFDLGIHDVDLWFYLYHQQVPWTVHAGYGETRREILVTLKDGSKILLDLLHKYVLYGGRSLDFSKSSPNNPILEMIFDLSYRGPKMNECWSREIRILEAAESGTIELR